MRNKYACDICGDKIYEEDCIDIVAIFNHGQKVKHKTICESCYVRCSFDELDREHCDDEEDGNDKPMCQLITNPSFVSKCSVRFTRYSNAKTVMELITNHIRSFGFITTRDFFNYCGIDQLGSTVLGWRDSSKIVLGKGVGGSYITLPPICS